MVGGRGAWWVGEVLTDSVPSSSVISDILVFIHHYTECPIAMYSLYFHPSSHCIFMDRAVSFNMMVHRFLYGSCSDVVADCCSGRLQQTVAADGCSRRLQQTVAADGCSRRL